MKSFGLIFGSSGTGKGTRVNQFMQFLNTVYTPTIKMDKDINGKLFPVGLYYKELDLLILGKYVTNKQTNITSWSSMDSLWSKYGGTEPTMEAISKFNHNVLCEGYANMDTFRVRPVHMNQKGCETFFYQTYSYGKEGFEDYLGRIIGRSGKEPKGTTAFEKDRSVEACYKKVITEMESLNKDTTHIYNYKFDKEIYSIGYDYLKFLGLADLAEEFLKYTETNKHFKKYEAETSNTSTVNPQSEDW